jgi:uncharacterized membrane protein (UPF0127 family)
VSRFDDLPVIELPGGLQVHQAHTWHARSRGLAKLDSLPEHAGLLIAPCRSIHTFGMRFALDLIWLDKQDGIVELTTNVAPRRLRSQLRRARAVIEVNAGHGARFAAAWPDR